MPLLRVFCWALIFILRLRFPPGSSIASVYNVLNKWSRFSVVPHSYLYLITWVIFYLNKLFTKTNTIFDDKPLKNTVRNLKMENDCVNVGEYHFYYSCLTIRRNREQRINSKWKRFYVVPVQRNDTVTSVLHYWTY